MGGVIVLGIGFAGLVVFITWYVYQKGRESVCPGHEWAVSEVTCLRCGRTESRAVRKETEA